MTVDDSQQLHAEAHDQGRDIMNHNNTLLRMIGLLGVSLPFLLLFGSYLSSGNCMEDSISAYYHSDMGYLFVGVMVATGAFLVSYGGGGTQDLRLFKRKVVLSDDGFTSITGVLAILVAVFPPSDVDVIDWAVPLHWFSAAAFLLATAKMSYSRFSRDDKDNQVLHKACASVILCALAVILIHSGLTKFWSQYLIKDMLPTLIWWLETIAVSAFGFSWLVRSKLIREGHFGKWHAAAWLALLYVLAGMVVR